MFSVSLYLQHFHNNGPFTKQVQPEEVENPKVEEGEEDRGEKEAKNEQERKENLEVKVHQLRQIHSQNPSKGHQNLCQRNGDCELIRPRHL